MATLLKNGNWKATWLNPETQKRESFESPISPEDAERRKAERIQGWKVIPSLSGVRRLETLEDCAMRLWWPSVEVKRPNTQRRYKDVWNRYIAPKFAIRAPKSLTGPECQEWANALLKGGMAIASVHLSKSVLVAILERCEREDLVTKNVAAYIELPPIPRRQRVMTVDQCWNLLARIEGTDLAAPVFLAAVLGLRRGEACGLKWENIDEKTSRVSITSQRLVIQGMKGKGIGEAEPKTPSSRRSFKLPKSLIKMLMNVGNLDSGYVCGRANNRPWNPEHLTWAWAKARKALGFGSWHYHDLRHGAAGILVALGVDLLTVGAILGQKSIDTTLLYAMVQDATATKGLEKVGKALGKSRRATQKLSAERGNA